MSTCGSREGEGEKRGRREGGKAARDKALLYSARAFSGWQNADHARLGWAVWVVTGPLTRMP